ncbi:hypothetical protein Droror1_Dr00009696 [Drosera rotundifolia]
MTRVYGQLEEDIKNIWGFKVGCLSTMYLGIPMIFGRLRVSHCRELIDKIRAKAMGCANRWLSYAGINDNDNNKSAGCGVRDWGIVVNCSDPMVLVAIQRFNARVFKSILIIEYGTPMNGSKGDECDVAWRFRNKREKSWRRYRDFKRFKVRVDELFNMLADC